MKTPIRAAILVRISDDRAGEGAGVARQEQDARHLAARLGWSVVETVVENDTSAYKRRRITRPDGVTEMRVDRPSFRRLLELIDSGQIDGLVAYHLDRVARDPRDLEDLIDVVERRRIPVESVTGSLRLASDSDITMARIGVAIANQSSRDASRRIRRKHEELATSGQYGGGGARRYGYEADGMTVRDDEAAVIRAAAARVLAGASVNSICRDLDANLVLPVKAATWSTKTLSDILRSPRIAGLRVHQGEVVGEAAWPAIIDRDTHDALVATLHQRSRGRGKPALSRWLNMLLWCSKCGHHLSANSTTTGPGFRYWCNSTRGGCGGLAIHGPQVEEHLEAEVTEYLRRPDVVSAFAAGQTRAAASDARADIEADEAQLKTLSRMWAERQITLDEYSEARRIIEGRLAAARAVMSSVIPERVRSVVTDTDPAGRWLKLGAAERRELVQVMLASLGYRGWRVSPADLSKPRRFDPTRLSLCEVSDV